MRANIDRAVLTIYTGNGHRTVLEKLKDGLVVGIKTGRAAAISAGSLKGNGVPVKTVIHRNWKTK